MIDKGKLAQSHCNITNKILFCNSIYLKKKTYFCQALHKNTNDSTYSNSIFSICSNYIRSATFCISVMARPVRRGKSILYAKYVIYGFDRIELYFGTSSHIQLQKKTTSICDKQIEHHIKLNFTRIICLSFTNVIWRGSSL